MKTLIMVPAAPFIPWATRGEFLNLRFLSIHEAFVSVHAFLVFFLFLETGSLYIAH